MNLGTSSGSQMDAAYDRASYLQERDLMMRTWADYLDDLRAGKPVRGNAPLTDVRAIQKSQFY